jgi:hypothetical protein
MTRVLVVANRTASTPALLAEVGARARAGASVTVLIPPEKAEQPDWTDEEAARLVGRAADQKVECLDAGRDALDTIHDAVGRDEFDEIIVCAKHEHLARWVHHDLPHRLEHIGLPVCVIPPEEKEIPDDIREGLPSGWRYPEVGPLT